MRAAVVVALLHALPGARGAANPTFVRGPEGLNYPEAAAFCTEIGATIASIRSAAENELAERHEHELALLEIVLAASLKRERFPLVAHF